MSMGFSGQEYWSGLPYPIPKDLPNPGIEPMSYISCIGSWVLYHYYCLGSMWVQLPNLSCTVTEGSRSHWQLFQTIPVLDLWHLCLCWPLNYSSQWWQKFLMGKNVPQKKTNQDHIQGWLNRPSPFPSCLLMLEIFFDLNEILFIP